MEPRRVATIWAARCSRGSPTYKLIGGDDQGALGFQKAAVDAGRREELIVIGVDGLREGQEGVADGRLDASIMFYGGHGPEAVGAIDQTLVLLRGGVHGDSVEMAHIFEMITVTKDNIRRAVDVSDVKRRC